MCTKKAPDDHLRFECREHEYFVKNGVTLDGLTQLRRYQESSNALLRGYKIKLELPRNLFRGFINTEYANIQVFIEVLAK